MKFNLKSLFSSIYIKIKDKIHFGLMGFGQRYEIARLTAWLMIRKTQKLNSSRRYKVLCIARTIFNLDVESLAAIDGEIQYLSCPKLYLDNLFRYYCKDDPDYDKLTESNYHTNNYCSEGKAKYYKQVKKIYAILKRKFKFEAVLVANFGYFCQQELAQVCVEDETAFITLHKEGLAIQDKFDLYVNKLLSGRKFVGQEVLFYNERIRRAMLDAGIDGVRPDNSTAVGIPRLDLYFNIAPPKPQKITFFSFFYFDKTRYFIEESELTSKLKKHSGEFHSWVIKFADRHPEYDITIKTKNAPHYLSYVRDIEQETVEGTPANLKITCMGNAFELIRDSAVVLGYNSTTLIESIVAGRSIISPWFGDLIPDMPWDFFHNYPGLVVYARSYEDLENCILSPRNNSSPEQRKLFLEELVYKLDGKARERIQERIIASIEALRNPECSAVKSNCANVNMVSEKGGR